MKTPCGELLTDLTLLFEYDLSVITSSIFPLYFYDHCNLLQLLTTLCICFTILQSTNLSVSPSHHIVKYYQLVQRPEGKMIYPPDRNRDACLRKCLGEEVTSNVGFGKSLQAACIGQRLKGIPGMENIFLKVHREKTRLWGTHTLNGLV